LSIINDMARFVLMDPNISAKELAEKMGYAEQKSVYYWLQKAGFKGMKDFRKAVLSRTFSISGEKPVIPIAKDAERVFLMPAYPQRRDLRARSSLRDYLANIITPEAFGILVETEISSLAHPGDLIVVDPTVSVSQGALLAASVGEELRLVRSYALPDKCPIFVDAGNPELTVTPEVITGKVLFIIRRMP